jgi:CRISPR-associated protein Cmr6
MPKGILKLNKTAKGKIIVALDRLNGKPPMPLSSVSLPDMTHQDKECEFGFDKGMVTFIKIEGVQIYPSVSVAAKSAQQVNQDRPQGQQANKTVPISNALLAETYLPRDVKKLNFNDIDNFNLKFNKATRLPNLEQIDICNDKKAGKFYFFKNDFRRNRDGKESGHKFLIKPNYGSLDFQQISKRLENQANTIAFQQEIKFSPDWRLILGIGGASVYEVGMTLHHIYGIPYIPASSIKGLVRTWIIQNCYGVEQDSEAKAFSESKLLCDIFGCAEKYDYELCVDKNGMIVPCDFTETDEFGKTIKAKKKKFSKNSFYKTYEKTEGKSQTQGDVIFFDAFPMSAPNVEPDIMNVHFPDYYNDNQGKVAPTDFQNPNPVPFLTVGKKDVEGQDLVFRTFIGIKNNPQLKMWAEDKSWKKLVEKIGLTGDNTILDLVAIWFKKALKEHGIGAKTAVGYGYMQ